MSHDYCFTEADMQKAAEERGANCGPSALAFAARIHIDAALDVIPQFDKRRYTSPTMMKAALASLGFQPGNLSPTFREDAGQKLAALLALLKDESIGLVRIQWTGPWTAKGMNPRWAYGQSHWIAGWSRQRADRSLYLNATVFDCNGGIRSLGSWEADIVPVLTSQIKRADGGWYPTHVWRIDAKGAICNSGS